MATYEQTKASLAAELSRAHSYATQRTAQLHENHVKPFADNYVASIQSYPLATTAATIFFVLSFLPVVVFAGFASLVLTGLLGSALVFVAFWSFIVLGGASVILLGVLAFTALLALIGTGFVAAAFLTYRLFVNVRQAPTVPLGVKTLGEEVKAYAQPATANGTAKVE